VKSQKNCTKCRKYRIEYKGVEKQVFAFDLDNFVKYITGGKNVDEDKRLDKL